ncbi:MAG TPA: tyrosinase family protein, partial [Nitrososphaera sp.]|nr:tyrosinase family protein [Nitrososphaera sp.]
MKCRKNVRNLSDTEKEDYVKAVIDLKNSPSLINAAQLAGATGRYDDYVWIHREVMGGAHTGPAFTPWHREFLKQFEQDLQQVSGNPNIMIPYWDWTTARASSDPGWPFTSNFMGGLGTGPDNRVMTGRFSEASGEWRLNVITGAGPTLPNGSPNPARDNTSYLRR